MSVQKRVRDGNSIIMMEQSDETKCVTQQTIATWFEASSSVSIFHNNRDTRKGSKGTYGEKEQKDTQIKDQRR